MAGRRQRRFVRDENALGQEREGAKLVPCPHCRRLGTINAHGFLRGYSECGEHGSVRGRRFFCSNRGRRPGCGRTFSVLVRAVISGTAARASTLSRFLCLALAGSHSVESAWQVACGGRLSRRTGFRMWKRLRAAQSRLRTVLAAHCAPPESNSPFPLAQLLEHMRCALPGPDETLLAAFQDRFQWGVFG